MLERILPPSLEPGQLPDPDRTAHDSWPPIACSAITCPIPRCMMRHTGKAVVARMVWRMEGHGNLGKFMQDMMAGVKAPGADEQARLRAICKNMRSGRSAENYSDLNTQSGRRSASRARNATCCPTRAATPRRNRRGWSSACGAIWWGQSRHGRSGAAYLTRTRHRRHHALLQRHSS